jgi:hypothetical protein
MTKIPNDQKHFLHGSDLSLEAFARSISEDKYYRSVSWTDIKRWQTFYLECLRIINRSLFATIGYVDPSHKKKIVDTLESAISKVKSASRKDEIHSALIVSLFKIIFLLLGRLPENSKGKTFYFSAFRTLTYCQTEEQLSYLLRKEIQRELSHFGFGDSLDADLAFAKWAKQAKFKTNDSSAYVKWFSETFPEQFTSFR